jgi:hypothetical protein
MAEEFTLLPDQSEVQEEFTLLEGKPSKKPRVSNPIKQGIAGVSDIFTSIPAAAGFIGAGGEAIYDTLTSDKKFSDLPDTFNEAASTGIDSDLLKMGHNARQSVNSALGIEDAVSTEDQIARIVGGFLLPVPAGFLGGAAATGMKGLAGKASTFVLPSVRLGPKGNALNKQFATRAAASVGIGGGFDQASRAFSDAPNTPLLLQDQALEGQREEFQLLGNKEEFEVLSDETDDPHDRGADLLDLDARVQKEADRQDMRDWMMLAAGALAVGAGARWARGGRTDTIREQANKVLESVTESQFDVKSALNTTLRDIGFTEKVRSKVVANADTDPLDQADHFLRTAQLGQGFKAKAGATPHSLVQLEADEIALGSKAELFNEAMEAQTIRASQLHGAGELFKNARPTHELDAVIKQARGDKQVKALMDKYTQTFDALLDYQVHRGTLTNFHANGFRRKAMLDDVPEGRLAYMPLYNRDPTTFVQNLMRDFLGKETKQGRQLGVVSEFGARSRNVGDDLLKPSEALRRYANITIHHANEQAFKAGALDALAQITRSGPHVVAENASRRKFSLENVTVTNGIVRGDGGGYRPTGRDTQYIGKGVDLSDIDNIPVRIWEGAGSRTSKYKHGTVNDLRAKHGDEIVTVHVGGELRVYSVPDPAIRASLELSPKLSKNLQMLSNWKNLFTQGTTGKFSLFAPVSGAFSGQQIAINTAAREGLGAGIKSIADSLSGTKQLLITNTAGARAQHLTRKIAQHMADGNVPPTAWIKLEERLSKQYANSVLSQVRRESGRTVTGMGNIGSGTLEDVLAHIGSPSSKFFGSGKMGLVSELWRGWNNAWHEGPAYGAMLKHIGKHTETGKPVTPQVIRDAAQLSKEVAGDMRKVGASGFSKIFNASTPFSAAMLQSWSSIGAAMKVDFGRFVAGASVLIGMPTVTEMLYNYTLSRGHESFPDLEDPEKSWTYNDYYWNGFTTDQRINNFIYFVPGRPPWEAVLIPVSPEWSLFRATVMEGMDAVFNFSDEGVIGDGQLDANKVGRDHMIAAANRFFDIPIPPLLAAGGSMLGQDIRAGISPDTPNPEGDSFSLLRAIPLGQTERVTGGNNKTRYVNGQVSTKVGAIIQDIFGSAGAAMVNVYDATASGLTGDQVKEGSVLEGISQGAQEFGTFVQSQTRYLQPLFGKAMRPNSQDEIAESLFTSRANLKNLATQFKSGVMGGGIVYADGKPIEGSTFKLSDDPINLELAAMAGDIDANIGQLDSYISGLRRDLSTMANSISIGSAREKYNKMDAKTYEITKWKAIQQSILHDFEDKVSTYLSEAYRRDIEIDLRSYTPRPDVARGTGIENITNPNSASITLPK